MDKFVIEGGVKLKGTVEVSGSKNSALPIIAASLLTSETVVLKNIPQLNDISTIVKLLRTLGAEVEMDGNTLTINARKLNSYKAPYELVKTMRASIYVMCPLLARLGKVTVALPGGCVIGQRPINLHLKGIEAMGAKVIMEYGYVNAAVKKLQGADIYLDVVSVGATANLIMAAVLAKGTTVIRNAAREPHIVDLGNFLNVLGANISGHGTDYITIKGVTELKGASYKIVYDYVEAGTLLVACAITRGKIKLNNAPVENLEAVIAKLEQIGANIKTNKDTIQIKNSIRPNFADITTSPYPGFPTDMQAQWTALMSIASGTSVITETIWENRFIHVAELCRMGADIKIEGNNAIVKGVPHLTGTQVMVSDLRAGAALVLAGLFAKGITNISRVYHLDRGYDKLEDKLNKLGAKIKRIRE